MKSTGFNLITVICIVLITALVSAFTTGVILNNNYKGQSGLTYAEVMNDEKLSEFLTLYSSLLEEYYDQIDKEGMIDSAISAMLEYLGDEYTTFLSPEENEMLQDQLKGTYQGIGITIRENEVIEVKEDSPAEKAGILSGDIITMVENQEITAENSSVISILIQESESNTVNLKINRSNELIDFNITKTELDSSIIYNMIDETNIGYIDIEVFSENVNTSFESALKDLESKNMTDLIIDMRQNTGGYLNKTVDIASLFLEKGEIIYGLEDKEDLIWTKDETSESRDYQIIILMDENSASASEVLAGALVDSYGAQIVGVTSYGKGKIQQTISNSDGSLAKYTSAKWYTPKSGCIDEIGIEPHYYIELEPVLNEEGNIIDIIDTQLNKAIELLKGAN